MSATLTWFSAGVGAKTGTTRAACINDLVTLVNTKSGDANFTWQVAASDTVGNPNYISFKPKSGAAGRVLVIIWSSLPGANNTTILDTAPVADTPYIAFFPNGNVDTPSNLNVASGVIMGSDTGAVKLSTMTAAITSCYNGTQQWSYFDCAEALLFFVQNPASAANSYLLASGYLIVDGADNAYACTFGGFGLGNLTGNGLTLWPWTGTAQQAGNGTAANVKTNYGANNRSYFQMWAGQPWASTAVGPTDILTDTSINKAYFVPIVLLGQAKNEGPVLKLRQITYGPATTGAFSVYNTTGPVVAARCINGATAGGNGFPWTTNFKV